MVDANHFPPVGEGMPSEFRAFAMALLPSFSSAKRRKILDTTSAGPLSAGTRVTRSLFSCFLSPGLSTLTGWPAWSRSSLSKPYAAEPPLEYPLAAFVLEPLSTFWACSRENMWARVRFTGFISISLTESSPEKGSAT
ncbi:MAG: hypothetical protein V2A71_00475 [Candidatus Eisenbacteria bacterium]